VLNLNRALILAGLAFFRTRRRLAVGILALRHQLGVLKRSVNRPRLTNVDRGLWVLLSRRWARWSDALIVVQPATVITSGTGQNFADIGLGAAGPKVVGRASIRRSAS